MALGVLINHAAGSAPQSASHEEFELLAQLRSGPLSGSQVTAAFAGLAGAALRARDDLGFNALDYALMGNKRENARYLASLGLEPEAPR